MCSLRSLLEALEQRPLGRSGGNFEFSVAEVRKGSSYHLNAMGRCLKVLDTLRGGIWSACSESMSATTTPNGPTGGSSCRRLRDPARWSRSPSRRARTCVGGISSAVCCTKIIRPRHEPGFMHPSGFVRQPPGGRRPRRAFMSATLRALLLNFYFNRRTYKDFK